MQELKNKIRSIIVESDKNLPAFSYSKIEVYKNCPMQYKFKYIDKKYSSDTSLALELGSLCHYVLEQKGKTLTAKKEVDYDKLVEILHNGVIETDEKTKECLLGIDSLKKKYFETWYEKDNASGMTYDDKIKIFIEVLHNEMEDSEWIPTYFEFPFEFVWDNKIKLKGFIDRIDTRTITEDGKEVVQYRTIDYKTSKKIYDEKQLPTSLQFGIYALAIFNEFKALPIQSEYHFILINKVQMALTKGYEKRLMKALDKVFSDIQISENSEKFKPSPTPLCYWCNFCKNNPLATEYQMECEYFSKWTPNEKIFETNKKWNELEDKKIEVKRKLIF